MSHDGSYLAEPVSASGASLSALNVDRVRWWYSCVVDNNNKNNKNSGQLMDEGKKVEVILIGNNHIVGLS